MTHLYIQTIATGYQVIDMADTHAEIVKKSEKGLPVWFSVNKAEGWISNWDISSMEMAKQLAKSMTENFAGDDLYIPTDEGDSVSPRYGVSKAPKVGDQVSYAFNGDCYPDGEITKVSAGVKMVVTTSTGSVYYRKKLSGGWKKQGGTWWMVSGHVKKQNPEF